MIAGSVRAVVGRFVRDRRAPAVVAFAIAFAIFANAFWSNEDNAGKPYEPRGKGKYLPVLARGDGHMLFLLCRSLVVDGDLILDNDLKDFGDPWQQPKSPTGRKYTAHPIGPPMIWAVPFSFADAGAHWLNRLGANIPRHGYTEWHQRAIYFWSVIFGVGSTILGYLVARRWLGGRWGPLYAAIAILFGTSLTYYATYMPSYGHAMGAFFSGLFFFAWARGVGDLRWRRFAILGALLGLAALVRGQELALGIVIALELAWMAIRPPPGAPGRARFLVDLAARGALALACAMIVFTPQMIAWHKITGEWWHSAHGPHYVRYGHPQILELLFSARNGWFSTTPLSYAAVIGLLLAPRRARFVSLALGAALFVQVWLDASILDWWSSASYGQRRLTSMTVIQVFGLASLLRAAWALASKIPVHVAARLVAAHALAAVTLFWFSAWNWNRVSVFKAGKAAGAPLGEMKWDGLEAWQKEIAEPIYRRIGNPFMFPANVWFAWRYDVDVDRFESIVGDYVYVPPLNNLRNDSYKKHLERWRLASVARKDWVVDGYGPTRHEDGREVLHVVAGRARSLVPLLMPERHRFIWSIASLPNAQAPIEVVVRWNGEVARTVTLPPGGAWTEVTWDAEVDVGMNELAIEAPPGSVRVTNLIVGFAI